MLKVGDIVKIKNDHEIEILRGKVGKIVQFIKNVPLPIVVKFDFQCEFLYSGFKKDYMRRYRCFKDENLIKFNTPEYEKILKKIKENTRNIDPLQEEDWSSLFFENEKFVLNYDQFLNL